MMTVTKESEDETLNWKTKATASLRLCKIHLRGKILLQTCGTGGKFQSEAKCEVAFAPHQGKNVAVAPQTEPLRSSRDGRHRHYGVLNSSQLSYLVAALSRGTQLDVTQR